MYNLIFQIIIIFLAGSFLLDKLLDYLNLKYTSAALPAEVSDVYEPERYKTSQDYKRVNTRFSFITGSFSLLLTLVVLFTGGFGYVDNLAGSLSGNNIIIALVFFAIIGLASDVLSLPFDLYATFVIEEKFGFNKTTPKLFFADKIKGWLLAAIIGGGLLALIIWVYNFTGEYFWLYAWGIVSIFSLLMMMFYSNLIVPLFNKQVPLEPGELKDAIDAFAKKAGFQLSNIYVIDGSKRSAKSNAYFTGLGKKKRIVLYDTLINDLSVNEIVAVLAHETGHYKKKHTLMGFLSGVIQTGLTLFLFSLLVENPMLSEALGAEQQGFHLSLIAFGILYSPVSLILGLLSNIVSRKNEYAADHFAAVNFGAEWLVSALKKLSSKNLGNLTPHPLYVFFHYSHPPLISRISALRASMKNGKVTY